MNRYDMIAFIVFIVMIASVARAYLLRGSGGGRRRGGGGDAVDDAETRRLREEVTQLRDRLAVLERIAVEKEHSLAREIESLRDH